MKNSTTVQSFKKWLSVDDENYIAREWCLDWLVHYPELLLLLHLFFCNEICPFTRGDELNLSGGWESVEVVSWPF